MSSTIRTYGRVSEAVEVPDLMELQIEAYRRFLQAEIHYTDREGIGLEAILSEIFPIQSYDGKITLTYLGYELGRPRYSPEELGKVRHERNAYAEVLDPQALELVEEICGPVARELGYHFDR